LNQIDASGSVTLISTGAITNGAAPGVANIVATGLTISAVGGIGTADTHLLTRVGTLNATNTGSGDIDIDNTYGTPAALNITGISTAGGGNVSIANAAGGAPAAGMTGTGPLSGGGGSAGLTLTPGSPLTIASNMIFTGPIVLTAAADPPFVGNDLTIDPG